LELCRALIGRKLVTAAAVRRRLEQTALDEREIRPVYERLREVSS
jgi:hypothetical protein